MSRNNCLSKDRKGGKAKALPIRIYDTSERVSPGFVRTELPSHKLPKKSLSPLQVWCEVVWCCAGCRSKAVQWPWCSAGKAVICFLAVARMRSGGLELHNSDTGGQLYPDHCTLLLLSPSAVTLPPPPPRPSWAAATHDCATQAAVLGICCGRVVVKCCCEVLL